MDNETLADIAREMRTYFQTQKRNGNPEHRPWHQVLSDWADRIEAAHAQEVRDAAMEHAVLPAVCITTTPPGNAAEMRKALERILDIEGYGAPWIEAKVIAQKALEGEQCTPPLAQESPKIEQQGNAAALRKALEDTEELLEHFAKPGTMLRSAFFLHMRDNRAALAEPPRNCDIGETDDQQYRFERLCNASPYCAGCPVYKRWGKRPKSCGIIWAQMPYEKEGAK